MSKKLYLYRPGQPGKPLKLAFTADDLPLLKQWYEDINKRDGLTNAPAFDTLPIETKNNMAKTLSFSVMKLEYAAKPLNNAIFEAVDKIKNMFR